MDRLLTAFFLFCSFNLATAQIFSDQSAAIGFDHAFAARALMGGGAAFFDYDLDGDEDIYVTSGYNQDEIYSNNGNGTFTKVNADIGLSITYQYNTMGVATGDIDNDGDRDIVIATWERFAGSEQPDARSLVFLNNGDGTFTEIGEQAGVTDQAFAMGIAFLDYNQDGYLDFYAFNHIKEQIFTYDDQGAINGMAHDCYPNFLYRNNGDLTFTEVSEELGVNNGGCTIAGAPSDYDMDGDLDLYLANDFGIYLTPNALLENNYPENTFSDVSVETESNVQAFGMGIAAGDFDHDLDFDYYTTNIGRNILIENIDGDFIDITTEAGVENTTVPSDNDLNTTGWGTAFFDIDNDTWEDLYVANGRIPTLTQFATATFDPDKLYLNNGDKTFTDITDLAGVGDVSYVHGMAYSDFDEDGDLDIVTVALNELGGHSKFYVNETQNNNNWIQFKLTGVESNRDAYGSKIWLFAGQQTFVKELYGGGASHASQHSSVFHFGLADITTVDSIRIDWTNGHIDHLGPFEVNERYAIEEGVLTDIEKVENHVLDISVNPNPFNDHFVIYSSTFSNEDVAIKLLTIDGRVVLEQKTRFTESMEVQIDKQLPSGFYLLQLQTANEGVLTKLVKL